MGQQWDFFKTNETSMGTFYPLHYIVAGYPSMIDARDAEDAFRESGVASDDVRAASGDFVVHELVSRDDRNLLEKMQNQLVKFVGTEKGYDISDRRHAEEGGAFLFVYAPDDADAEGAREVFAEHPPKFARRYLRVAIERMVRNPDAI